MVLSQHHFSPKLLQHYLMFFLSPSQKRLQIHPSRKQLFQLSASLKLLHHQLLHQLLLQLLQLSHPSPKPLKLLINIKLLLQYLHPIKFLQI